MKRDRIETVPIGPVRIPKSYKAGLDTLRKDHVTYSDLIREAIYLLLVKKEVIKDD